MNSLLAALAADGFRESAPVDAVRTLVHGPRTNEYWRHCLVGERLADVAVRLHDTRLLLFADCGDHPDVDRLALAADKAAQWLRKFGDASVVPVTVLAGPLDIGNIEYAQGLGLSVFWLHRLGDLSDFIGSTAAS